MGNKMSLLSLRRVFTSTYWATLTFFHLFWFFLISWHLVTNALLELIESEITCVGEFKDSIGCWIFFEEAIIVIVKNFRLMIQIWNSLIYCSFKNFFIRSSLMIHSIVLNGLDIDFFGGKLIILVTVSPNIWCVKTWKKCIRNLFFNIIMPHHPASSEN